MSVKARIKMSCITEGIILLKSCKKPDGEDERQLLIAYGLFK